MRNCLILTFVFIFPLVTIGCDSAGSNNEASSGPDDEPVTTVEGQYQMTSVDQKTIPLMLREETVDVPQTGQEAQCEIWLLEDAWILTFQEIGGVVAKRIESFECTTVEDPIYTYGGKRKSERIGQYGRIGENIDLVWDETLVWRGTIVGGVITFTIPSHDPELAASEASFKK